MRAVAGFLFLLIGLMMAYLVLTGKLPSTQPIVQAPSSAPSSGPDYEPKPTTGRFIGGGSMGIPSMAHLQDVAASQGAYR